MYLYELGIILVPKVFLVGPLKAQELSDSFDYQRLRTEIYCVKSLKPG